MIEKLLHDLKGVADNVETRESILPRALLMLKIVETVCIQLSQNYEELKKDNENRKLIIDAQEQYSRRNCLLIQLARYNDRNDVFLYKNLKNSNVMITENLAKMKYELLRKSLGILRLVVLKYDVLLYMMFCYQEGPYSKDNWGCFLSVLLWLHVA